MQNINRLNNNNIMEPEEAYQARNRELNRCFYTAITGAGLTIHGLLTEDSLPTALGLGLFAVSLNPIFEYIKTDIIGAPQENNAVNNIQR